MPGLDSYFWPPQRNLVWSLITSMEVTCYALSLPPPPPLTASNNSSNAPRKMILLIGCAVKFLLNISFEGAAIGRYGRTRNDIFVCASHRWFNVQWSEGSSEQTQNSQAVTLLFMWKVQKDKKTKRQTDKKTWCKSSLGCFLFASNCEGFCTYEKRIPPKQILVWFIRIDRLSQPREIF